MPASAPKPPTPDDAPPERPLYRARHRLTHKREFDAVYAAKARKSPPSDPGEPPAMTVFAVPNTLGHCRLGLSVGKRIGNAPQRNALKRKLREAFRTARPAWDAPPTPGDPHPVGLDLIISALPHPPRSPARYAEMLTWCVDQLRRLHAKRAARHPAPPPERAEP